MRYLPLPSTLVSAALIGGLLLLAPRRTRRAGIGLLAAGAALLALLGTGPVSFLMLGSLEYRNRPLDETRVQGPIRYMVVMAGYAESSVHQPLSSYANVHTASRLLEARRLHSRFPDATVVVSGQGEVPAIMRRVLVSQGVPPERIVVDDRSRSTRETSRNLRELIGTRPFLLVTSAGHMSRCLMAFRERVMAPIPAPTGYLTRKNILAVDYLPSVNNLMYADLAVTEYLGILWYRMTPGRDSSGGEGSVVTGRKGENVLRSGAGDTGTIHRGKVVILLGASYAEGMKEIPLENITVINKGVSGEQTFEMLARFNRDVLGERPDAVVIWGFINDIFRSERDGISSKLERTRGNISEMVEMARANGIKPILATEVTIREKNGLKEAVLSWMGRVMGKEGYQDYVNRHVLSTNQWIREYAKKQGVPLLDFQPLLADARGKRGKAFAMEDGSHISVAGYSRLSLYSARELQDLLK